MKASFTASLSNERVKESFPANFRPSSFEFGIKVKDQTLKEQRIQSADPHLNNFPYPSIMGGITDSLFTKDNIGKRVDLSILDDPDNSEILEAFHRFAAIVPGYAGISDSVKHGSFSSFYLNSHSRVTCPTRTQCRRTSFETHFYRFSRRCQSQNKKQFQPGLCYQEQQNESDECIGSCQTVS